MTGMRGKMRTKAANATAQKAKYELGLIKNA